MRLKHKSIDAVRIISYDYFIWASYISNWQMEILMCTCENYMKNVHKTPVLVLLHPYPD